MLDEFQMWFWSVLLTAGFVYRSLNLDLLNLFTSQYVSCFPVPFFFVTLFFKVNHHESPAEKLLQNGNILIYFVCVSTVCSVVLQRADEFLVDSCIYVSVQLDARLLTRFIVRRDVVESWLHICTPAAIKTVNTTSQTFELRVVDLDTFALFRLPQYVTVLLSKPWKNSSRRPEEKRLKERRQKRWREKREDGADLYGRLWALVGRLKGRSVKRGRECERGS